MNFGRLFHSAERRSWLLAEVPPHVALRLKRVFGKLREDSFGVHGISDTLENSRDLAWFMERYPLEADADTLVRLRARAAAHTRQEETVAKVLAGGGNPLDVELKLPLREYQALAARLTLAAGSLLCADDVGLGKTAIAIGVVASARARPALIVSLTHLPLQISRELRRFAPQLRSHILRGTRPYDMDQRACKRKHAWLGQSMEAVCETCGCTRAEVREGVKNEIPDVILTSYSKLAGWGDVLGDMSLRTVVFDEAQELRRYRDSKTGEPTAKYAAAKYVREKAHFCLMTTATPIFNYGSEFWSLTDILRPDAIGRRDEFVREWCTGGAGDDKETVKDTKAFGAHLRSAGLMIRRTRREVGRELPPLQTVPHHVDADERELDKVKGTCGELARRILQTTETVRGEKFKISGEFDNAIRQATGVAKAPYVADFVRMLAETGEKVVLYGWHRAVYAVWNERLKDLFPVMYTGSESSAQKEAARAAFCDPNGASRVLIISLRAGAGLDGLQHVCRTVVYGELDWSPAVHMQCLSSDTEVLTPSGFKSLDSVEAGDPVFAFDPADGTIRSVQATQKVVRPLARDERMFGVCTIRTDLRVTGDHRLVVRRKTRKTAGVGRTGWGFELAKNVAGVARRFIPLAGMEDSSGVPLTSAELRLIGWFISDGSFNGKGLTFYQAVHQPWNEDLVATLDACGMTWSRMRRQIPSGEIYYYFVPRGVLRRWSPSEVAALTSGDRHSEKRSLGGRSKVACAKKRRKLARGEQGATRTEIGAGMRGWNGLEPYLDKNLSPLLESMTRDQLLDLIHGLHMGDGTKSYRAKRKITSTNKVLIDRLQSLCIRRGLSANVRRRSTLTSAGNVVYDLIISQVAEASLPRADKPNGFAEVSSTEGETVWCLTNSLGTLVTRRDGKVAIVGNCTGRVFRDGQKDPVVAYYLIADSGSDPVVSDVLGVKREQLLGVTDPDEELIENLEIDPNRIKRLAESYLSSRGDRPKLPKEARA